MFGRSFDGKVASKGVSIRGKSKVEEGREALLERTRLEREQRKRAKLETRSATIIQARWRGYRSKTAAQRAIQDAWIAQYGLQAERADLSCLALSSSFLSALLFSIDVRKEADVLLLSAACSMLLRSGNAGWAQLLSPSLQGGSARRVLLLRLQQLARSCLLALSYHRISFAPVLSAPCSRSTPASVKSQMTPDGQSSHPAAMLVALLLQLTSEHTYQLALGAIPPSDPPSDMSVAGDPVLAPAPIQHHAAAQDLAGNNSSATQQQQPQNTLTASPMSASSPEVEQASAAAVDISRRVRVHMAECGMADRLRQLLAASLEDSVAGASTAASPGRAAPHMAAGTASDPMEVEESASEAQRSAVQTQHGGSCVEALVTQLTVGLLALAEDPAKPWYPSAASQALHNLLFVPQLFERCRALHAVTGRLIQQAVTGLAAVDTHGFVSALPGDVAGGRVGALACLLGNLVKHGATCVSILSSSQAAATQSPLMVSSASTALSLLITLQRSLALLPLSTFFPEDVLFTPGDPDNASGGGGTAAAAAAAATVAATALPPGMQPLAMARGETLPPRVIADGRLLLEAPGRELLKQLTAVLLPLQRPPPPPGGGGNAAAFASAPAAAAAPPPRLHRASQRVHEHAAYVLSQLVRQLSVLPAARQRLLLSLATGGDLVERLWFSVLRYVAVMPHDGTWLRTRRPLYPSFAPLLPSQLVHAAPSAASSASAIPAMQLQSGLHSSGASNVNGPSIASTPVCGGTASVSNGEAAGSGAHGSSSSSSALHRPTPWWSCHSQDQSSSNPSMSNSHQQQTQQQQQQTQQQKLSGQQQKLNGQQQEEEDPFGWLCALSVCCSAFSSHMVTAGLEDFYAEGKPLPLQEIVSGKGRGFLPLIQELLWQALWTDADRSSPTTAAATLRAEFVKAAGRLYGQLYDRNCRTQFAPPEAFCVSDLRAGSAHFFGQEALASHTVVGGLDPRSRLAKVLAHAPALVPFEERARIFQEAVALDRKTYRETEMAHAFDPSSGFANGHRFVPIRRDQLLYDGFERLNALGEALKGRVRVQFISEHGEPEAGVDGGGLFKDFLEALMKEGFSTQHGLFAANPAQQLYPAPGAVGTIEDAPRLLEFLGRMLGKAMYEGILLELPLAGFFLKKLKGGYADLNDLPTLDPEVYRNLTSLRRYPGDVADLCLSFSITDSIYGVHSEVELKPGGRLVTVTGDNVLEYIHRVADYRLNRQTHPAFEAFKAGFSAIIPPEWVAHFNEFELQMLISGSEEGLNLEDLKAHVAYAGGYTEEHPVVEVFWKALESFTHEEQREFLKFVTACSRAPLLGFRYLEPTLCVQMAGGMLDQSSTGRLPTAATCMNLLKLPPYRTVQMMRDKLLYAIKSGAGFDLS